MKNLKKALTNLLFCLMPIICYSQNYKIGLIGSDSVVMIPFYDYRPMVFAVDEQIECEHRLKEKQILIDYNILGWELAEAEIKEYKESFAAKKYDLVQNDTIQSHKDLIIQGLKKRNKELKIELTVVALVLIARVLLY